MVRFEPRNPLVKTVVDGFCEVGYPTGGTPVPVSSIGAGAIPPTTLFCGSLFPAGTANGIVLGTGAIHNSVLIQAYYANVGTVFVGCGSATVFNGIAMLARDTCTVVVDNLSDIFVNVSKAGEGISYLGS